MKPYVALRGILAAASLMALSGVAGAAPPTGFERRVEELRKQYGAPGVTIAIVENGQTTLATKSDLEHVREVLSKDLAKVGELLSKDIVTVELRMDKKLSDLGDRLTMRLGGLMAAMIGAATALISAVQYFT